MLEPVVLLMLVALFRFGYGTRSYIGTVVPAALFVGAVIVYQRSTPSGDEVDVLPTIYLAASGLGVLIYLGGVVLGRHRGVPTAHRSATRGPA